MTIEQYTKSEESILLRESEKPYSIFLGLFLATLPATLLFCALESHYIEADFWIAAILFCVTDIVIGFILSTRKLISSCLMKSGDEISIITNHSILGHYFSSKRIIKITPAWVRVRYYSENKTYGHLIEVGNWRCECNTIYLFPLDDERKKQAIEICTKISRFLNIADKGYPEYC